MRLLFYLSIYKNKLASFRELQRLRCISQENKAFLLIRLTSILNDPEVEGVGVVRVQADIF